MKISVIGAGAMGGATVEGLIKGQQFKNEDITVSDPSTQVTEKFAKMGVSVTTDNKLAADTADIVMNKHNNTVNIIEIFLIFIVNLSLI